MSVRPSVRLVIRPLQQRAAGLLLTAVRRSVANASSITFTADVERCFCYVLFITVRGSMLCCDPSVCRSVCPMPIAQKRCYRTIYRGMLLECLTTGCLVGCSMANSLWDSVQLVVQRNASSTISEQISSSATLSQVTWRLWQATGICGELSVILVLGAS